MSGVDIILPTFNCEQYVKETLDSIISQSFENWKLIIIDDASKDSTVKLIIGYLRDKRINFFQLKKNKGAGFCRNFGLRNSKSEYVAFIDSDDIWEKKKLSNQINFMQTNNYHFTYTNYSAFRYSKGKEICKEIIPPKYMTFEKFIKNTSISTSSMIVKRSSIGNAMFSNTKICEDYFFKCQILKKNHYAYCLHEKLSKYRIRKYSLQSNKIRNVYWIWYINKNYNKLSFFKNLISTICISLNSIKKYGFK